MTARTSATGASHSLGRIYKNGARSNSKLLYFFIPGGIVFCYLPGFCLPISYVAHPNTPHPYINFVLFALLPIGLLLSAVGHRMARGQWNGVSQQLHAQLAMTGLWYTLVTARYVFDGAHLRGYPAGVLLMISLILMASRLLVRYAFHNRYPWE